MAVEGAESGVYPAKDWLKPYTLTCACALAADSSSPTAKKIVAIRVGTNRKHLLINVIIDDISISFFALAKQWAYSQQK